MSTRYSCLKASIGCMSAAFFAGKYPNTIPIKEAITTSNYSTTYGFRSYYWSSSQGSAGNAFYTFFDFGYMTFSNVNSNDYVRLGATF